MLTDEQNKLLITTNIFEKYLNLHAFNFIDQNTLVEKNASIGLKNAINTIKALKKLPYDKDSLFKLSQQLLDFILYIDKNIEYPHIVIYKFIQKESPLKLSIKNLEVIAAYNCCGDGINPIADFTQTAEKQLVQMKNKPKFEKYEYSVIQVCDALNGSCISKSSDPLPEEKELLYLEWLQWRISDDVWSKSYENEEVDDAIRNMAKAVIKTANKNRTESQPEVKDQEPEKQFVTPDPNFLSKEQIYGISCFNIYGLFMNQDCFEIKEESTGPKEIEEKLNILKAFKGLPYKPIYDAKPVEFFLSLQKTIKSIPAEELIAECLRVRVNKNFQEIFKQLKYKEILELAHYTIPTTMNILDFSSEAKKYLKNHTLSPYNVHRLYSETVLSIFENQHQYNITEYTIYDCDKYNIDFEIIFLKALKGIPVTFPDCFQDSVWMFFIQFNQNIKSQNPLELFKKYKKADESTLLKLLEELSSEELTFLANSYYFSFHFKKPAQKILDLRAKKEQPAEEPAPTTTEQEQAEIITDSIPLPIAKEEDKPVESSSSSLLIAAAAGFAISAAIFGNNKKPARKRIKKTTSVVVSTEAQEEKQDQTQTKKI